MWRSKPLPKDWGRTRRRILRRDQGICYICGRPGASQIDHIVPASQGGGDEDENLAAVHQHPCHARKTAREANAKNPKAVPRRRAPEKHPGEISPASPAGKR